MPEKIIEINRGFKHDSQENDSFEEILNEIRGQEVKELLTESPLANGKDCYKFFPYPRYKVYVYSSDEHLIEGQAHFHVIDLQENWVIKMTMRGDLLEVVNHGKRDGSDTFSDIVKKLKDWLPRKSKTYPEISNFVRIQRLWNDNNAEKGLEIEVDEW